MARVLCLALLAACGSPASNHGIDASNPTDGQPSGDGRATSDAASGDVAARHILVIPLENKDSTMIYGDTTDAPYVNGLIAMGGIGAHTTNFQDELAISIPSEPHYIWMEAGTNVFSDITFTTDNDPSSSNSTSSTDHLATQLTAAGRSWIAYQEGITSGTCPIASSGEYAAKHSPFVFFQDIAGSPPAAATANCASHEKSIADLTTDLANDSLPNYAFITPDLCHEMHGDLLCPSGLGESSNIAAGDAWLQANLPPLIAYTHTHDATIFLVWDEGDATRTIPFIAIGDHVVAGATSAVMYNHGSMVKTVEELLGVPVLSTVASTTDLSALFETGYVPQ